MAIDLISFLVFGELQQRTYQILGIALELLADHQTR